MSIKMLERLAWWVAALLILLVVLSIIVTAIVTCAIADPRFPYRQWIFAGAACYGFLLVVTLFTLMSLYLRIAQRNEGEGRAELASARVLIVELQNTIAANVLRGMEQEGAIRLLRSQLTRVTEEAERLTVEIERRSIAANTWRTRLFEPRDTRPKNT